MSFDLGSGSTYGELIDLYEVFSGNSDVAQLLCSELARKHPIGRPSRFSKADWVTEFMNLELEIKLAGVTVH